MSIDFSDLPLSPSQARAARNYLGLSQANVAEKSGLPAHKLKRFELENYEPDHQFLQGLRDFFEGQDYNFRDDKAPGAKLVPAVMCSLVVLLEKPIAPQRKPPVLPRKTKENPSAPWLLSCTISASIRS